MSQRVYQLIGEYEDANDSNQLRHDPIYKIACDRLPLAGEELLASQPTMTRLENHVSKREVAQMQSRMVERFIGRYAVAPDEIVLDIDGWDDPLMYFPVLINEASSGYGLVLQLRAGNAHPGKGVAGIWRWLFWRLKRAFPEVRIVLRADAGFALPEILLLCERSGVGYTIGFAATEPPSARAQIYWNMLACSSCGRSRRQGCSMMCTTRHPPGNILVGW